VGEPTVSVLLPSRGRPQSLARSCESLLSRALDAARIEVWVGYDDDDPETGVAARDLGYHAVSFSRHGYYQLHLYVNELAKQSSGQWLFLWNDDAFMETAFWDLILDRYDPDTPLVLSPASTGVGHSMCCFPIASRALYARLDHLSLSPHIDSWLQDLGNQAGILKNIDVDILHDRYDLTGGHNDETWAESRSGYRTSEFYSEPIQRLLRRDISKAVSC
jgi:hypothetical protein